MIGSDIAKNQADSSDIVRNLVLFLIFSVAVVTGVISYLYNDMILISAAAALAVVFQGVFTWLYGRKRIS